MSIDYNKLAIDTAKLSPAKKRKVGAVVVGATNHAVGFNYHPTQECCELEDGSTSACVIHAEIAALHAYTALMVGQPSAVYVTETPCAACSRALQDAGVVDIHIVEEFMKFDSEKLRYELIPPATLEGLAKVLTYGARKYKPNNWKKGEISRYEGAAMRHLNAWRAGEKRDKESGLLHLEHLLTNVCFLLDLDNENQAKD